jgi:hypothetical protein
MVVCGWACVSGGGGWWVGRYACWWPVGGIYLAVAELSAPCVPGQLAGKVALLLSLLHLPGQVTTLQHLQ